MPLRSVLGSLVAALTLSGCGPAVKEAAAPARPAPPPHAAASAASNAPAAPEQPPLLSAQALTTVPAGTFGPYLSMQASGGLAIWAAGDNDVVRGLFALPITAQGEPRGPVVRFGEAPREIGLVTVRPLPSGFGLVSTRKVSDGEVVEWTLLSSGGARQSAPVTVGRTDSSLLWVEALPTPRGVLVMWAARGDGRASLFANEVTAKGDVPGQAQEVAKDAGAWQAVKFGDSVALAVVHVSEKPGQQAPLDLRLIGDPSKLGPPINVNPEPTAELDVDMAVVDGRALVVWSDHRGVEARVYSALVDASGKLLAPPAPATPALGDQAVVRVVPPAAGGHAYLVWEDLPPDPQARRVFEIAALGSDGRISGPHALLEYWQMDGSVPELVAGPGGLAALTLAPLCARGVPCPAEAPVVPEFIQFDASLNVVAAEPLRVAPQPMEPTPLAWNLSCPGPCYALAALNSAPSPVYLARLEHRSDAFRSAAGPQVVPEAPRVTSDEAVLDLEPLSKLATAELDGASLFGWVTDFDPTTPWVRLKTPAPDGRFDPLRARLEVRAVAARDPFRLAPAGEPISLRAHSVSGIAITPGDRKSGQALVSWGGMDLGQPQLFLTLVDRTGRKLTQQMLTHKSGELESLVSAYTGDGYVVGWVDERTGDPEVYATKVNGMLNRVAPEQRITNSVGAAVDLSIVTREARGLFVWSDARESEHAGWADIYAVPFNPKDAARSGPEVCLAKTRPHSFSPVARARGASTFVAWLEARSEETNEPARVMSALLDDSAHVVGEVGRVTFDAGEPRALALDCDEHACHAVILAAVSDHSELFAMREVSGQLSEPVRLRALAGASSVAPLLRGSELFATDLRDGRSRLRHLMIDW